MFTSQTGDRLDFVSRQISNLLDDHSLDAALQRLSEASPAEYSGDIEYFRDLLTSRGDEAPTSGPNRYRVLSKLLPAVSRNRSTLFRGFVDYVRESRVVFDAFWTGVIGMIWYLAAVSLVALMVSALFGFYVVPTFNDYFAQHGARLPELTRFLFASSGAGIPAFAIALSVLIALAFWFTAMLHRRILQLAPLPRWPTWIPLAGRISRIYNLGLFLNFARLLRHSDVEASRAVSVAASQSNQPDELSYESLAGVDGEFRGVAILTELAVAARLGHFDSELAHQCDRHLGRLTASLVEVRDKFSLVLKMALYVFVAVLIVAMYLPIFQMGSLV